MPSDLEGKIPCCLCGASVSLNVQYTNVMNEKLIEKLKTLAKKKIWEDKLTTDGKCIVDDFAGGNVDDAYLGGFESGQTIIARDVLDELGISYE